VTKAYILCQPEGDLHKDPIVVKVKKSGVEWGGLDAANDACDALVDLFPQHMFIVVESMDFGEILI